MHHLQHAPGFVFPSSAEVALALVILVIGEELGARGGSAHHATGLTRLGSRLARAVCLE